MDLGVVQTNKGENLVEVAVPMVETDINAVYENAIHVLSIKPLEGKKVDAATAQEDYHRNVRIKCAASPSFSLLLVIIFFCVVC